MTGRRPLRRRVLFQVPVNIQEVPCNMVAGVSDELVVAADLGAVVATTVSNQQEWLWEQQ